MSLLYTQIATKDVGAPPSEDENSQTAPSQPKRMRISQTEMPRNQRGNVT